MGYSECVLVATLLTELKCCHDYLLCLVFKQSRVRSQAEDDLEVAVDASSEIVQGIHLLAGEVPLDGGNQGLTTEGQQS